MEIEMFNTRNNGQHDTRASIIHTTVTKSSVTALRVRTERAEFCLRDITVTSSDQPHVTSALKALLRRKNRLMQCAK